MAFSTTMHKCVALLMSALVPAAVMASDWGGTITTSNGVVSLNGQVIRGSHTIMPGDLINTAKGRAMVRLANGNVAIAENTNARFQGSSVDLSNGFAEISGSKELTAHYRDLTIHSVGGESATFVVGELQGKPTVAALKGAILVSDANGSVVLPAGRAMEADTDEDTPTPVAAGQENKPAEPAAKGGHSSKQDEQRGGPRNRNRKMLAGWKESAVLLGLIGGTLAGLWLGGVFDRKSVSNQVP